MPITPPWKRAANRDLQALEGEGPRTRMPPPFAYGTAERV
jgi:hypothetical protein